MVTDKYAEITNESIRRMIDKCMECPENFEEPMYDPALGDFSLEEMRRHAALCHAMTRIIESAQWN